MTTPAATDWDPERYQRFGDERSQPFFDLLTRIRGAAPRRVVDLGCGPGNLTEVLADRWPEARVTGLDASPEMIAAARTRSRPGLDFELGRIEDWVPAPDVDVVITNAALQWVPGHRDLLPGWLEALPAGAAFAIQVPGNFGAPSHALQRELSEDPRFTDALAGVLRIGDVAGEPQDYLGDFLAAGWRAEAWETTYLHVLQGPNPVLEWVRGTSLRPILAALGDRAGEFEAEYAARLREAYPRGEHGTVLPFRRSFAVGVKG